MPPTPDLHQQPHDALQARFGPFVDLLADPAGELRLESLVKQNLLSGFAWRYTVIIPLLSEIGEEVFSLQDDLPPLTAFLNHRFGGSTSLSHQGGPPLVGNWDGVWGDSQDQNTSIMVYSRTVKVADVLFGRIKEILKQVGVQEEILIEKCQVTLIG